MEENKAHFNKSRPDEEGQRDTRLTPTSDSLKSTIWAIPGKSSTPLSSSHADVSILFNLPPFSFLLLLWIERGDVISRKDNLCFVFSPRFTHLEKKPRNVTARVIFHNLLRSGVKTRWFWGKVTVHESPSHREASSVVSIVLSEFSSRTVGKINTRKVHLEKMWMNV